MTLRIPLILLGLSTLLTAAPFQATGFKTGEISSDSAIVWTRTTQNEKPNPGSAPMATYVLPNGEEYTPDVRIGNRPKRNVDPEKVTYPEGKGVGDIRFAAPGTEGETRVSYRPQGEEEWETTDWEKVDPAADFTRQFRLSGLDPGQTYEVRVEARGPGGSAGETLTGRFRTAPAPDQSPKVVFTVSTGQMFTDQDRRDGFQIYPTMLRQIDPDFFVHTGDIVYYDRLAKNVELAHWHWQRTYSRPTNVDFQKKVGSYFIKDDHETWTNDCWPGMKSNMGTFTFEDGVRIFKEQVPMGDKTYRTYRWGKDLQIWMVEGRDYRSPNNMPDGPEKTIWGDEQKQWLFEGMKASDATFRVLISPTPIVGPDRDNKRDNHSNKAFSHEGKEVRQFLSTLENVAVICGDRHWQYHSIDPDTGVREYSCGPASNAHAGGWSQKDFRPSIHRFLRVEGGFLAVTCERENGEPTLAFRFHGVDGKVHFEDVLN